MAHNLIHAQQNIGSDLVALQILQATEGTPSNHDTQKNALCFIYRRAWVG